jgi:hypothetical protein
MKFSWLGLASFLVIAAGSSAQSVAPPYPVRVEKLQPHPHAEGNVALNWRTGEGGSYRIPTFEVPGFLAALSIYDRIAIPHDVYDSTLKSTWEHVHEQHWVFDTDPFNINQFAHPYQGSMMFGFARSTGVGFWQSLIYSNAGSMIWKMAGETDLPSINDQITTGTAGALFGEALFRMAGLVLESGGEHPGVWRELGAAILSPPTGFNRLMFGHRFRAVFPSYNPATFMRFRLGASIDANVTSNGVTSKPHLKQEAIADFTLVYGLPGKADYEYKRPFDYFSFEAAAKTSAHAHDFIEDVMIRGMLYGRDFSSGKNHRAIAGVYGSYDYISPQIFRVSSTAVGFGTTNQWWLSRQIALQGTAMAGIGFAGAGNTPQSDGLRDYHYGATPQGLLAVRTIFGHRAMFDLTAREYYVSGTGSDDKRGSEQIFRADAGLTVRLFEHQALGFEFLAFQRRAHYVRIPNRTLSEGTISIVYTLLFGGTRFGAVDWRPNGERVMD